MNGFIVVIWSDTTWYIKVMRWWPILPIKGVEPDGEDETDDDDLFGLHIHHLVSSLLLSPALLFSQVNRDRHVLIAALKLHFIINKLENVRTNNRLQTESEMYKNEFYLKYQIKSPENQIFQQ